MAEWLTRYPVVSSRGWHRRDAAVEAMLAETRRCMARPGFKGISIEPTIAPGFSSAADPRLFALYDECQRIGAPVSITLSAILQASERCAFDHGKPAQIYDVARMFPKVTLHVAHAAWPWVMDMIGVAFTCPNVWLSPDQYLVSTLPGAELYAKAAASYFPERMLFGTAYPFKPLAPMVAAYRSWQWPAPIERKILGENALRLDAHDLTG